MNQNRTLTMVDLFAGCGGLGLGMENAGFLPVFVNELNEDAMRTYLANRHHEVGGKLFAEQPQLHCRDAHELQGDRLEQLVADLEGLGLGLRFPSKQEADAGVGTSSLDLVAGGPPCQGYSEIGHRRSYGVHREKLPSNQLYQRMAKIIARLRPRLFLFENVKGLRTARWTPGGKLIWPDVLTCFRGIRGYQVRYSLIRASDYGVPQNRPRLLLVGVRNDVVDLGGMDAAADAEDAIACGFLPAGGQKAPGLLELLGDLVDESISPTLGSGAYPAGIFETKEYPRLPRNDVQAGFRGSATSPSRTPAGYQLTEHEYSKHGGETVAKFQYMLENGGRIPSWAKTKKFNQRVLPERWDDRGPLITATTLPDDYVHFSQPRILTVREWARLQTFPDWYVFKGKRTTGGLRRAGNPREGVFDREVPKYTQIGNAVPVWLAEAVGDHFRALLSSADRTYVQGAFEQAGVTGLAA